MFGINEEGSLVGLKQKEDIEGSQEIMFDLGFKS